ncbi:MAG: sulfotransferase [Actinomycetota bacterium]
MTDPFFIIGAPRSGTTFLVELLNAHPKVMITDETRVMTHVSRILNDMPNDRRAVMNNRAAWLEHLRAEFPRIVRGFYEKLGAPMDGRWGDKNPHYSERRTDPACLETIDRLFPKSQFIHIVRDGRAVVSSLFSLGWAKNPAYAADVWRRHVEQSRDFGSTIGPKRYLEVTYEHLMAEPELVTKELFEFLGMDVSTEVERFLREEQEQRRPVSGATTDLSKAGTRQWESKLDADVLAAMNYHLADLLVEYGYETPAWRDALTPTEMPVYTEPRRQVELDVEAFLKDGSGDPNDLLKALFKEYQGVSKERDEQGRERGELKEALDAERRAFNRLKSRQRRLLRKLDQLDPEGSSLEAKAAKTVRASKVAWARTKLRLKKKAPGLAAKISRLRRRG